MSFDNNIVVIKLNTVDTPICFPSQETNCTQCHFKFRASANEAAANLFSFAVLSGEERCVTIDDPNNGCEGDNRQSVLNHLSN